MVRSIALSLVSHTNVGKTTLARTLLRRDVGSVFDQAHVTDVSEAWTLLESDDGRLLLWDTPGFGDTVRLLRRLRNEGNPVGWFLHQVWDRLGDRALWCSQEAVRNIRDSADLVLYLVNATEDPQDAGYVGPELELLAWLGKPVLLLLNQTGNAGDTSQLEQRWRQAVAAQPHVQDVLSLDAFTRCWVQEGVLLAHAAALLPETSRETMDALVARWNERNLETFRSAVAELAGLLAETAADTELLPAEKAGRGDKKHAMAAMAQRVEQRAQRLMERLLELHGLEGDAARQVRDKLEDFHVAGESRLSVRGGALWGGLVSGAASGVAADLLTGGLSFGGGAVVGAVLGALGGAGLAKGYQEVVTRGRPAVRWGRRFLDQLVRQVLLDYLAVAQFGRGRGAFHDDVLAAGEAAGPWSAALDAALASSGERITAAWELAGSPAPGSGLSGMSSLVGRLGKGARGPEVEPVSVDEVHHRLARIVGDVLRAALVARYPECEPLLRRGAPDAVAQR